MNLSVPEIPVIYFHSVAPVKNINWPRGFLTLELRQFEEFLIYLKKNRWKTIFLDEYYALRKAGKKQTAKICCLTFDDGFLDNYIYAYPLLKKHGFTATLFIAPEFIDTQRKVAHSLEDVWGGYVTLDEVSQWGYLSWDEMRIMLQSKIIDIQAHTLTHTKYFVSDELASLHRPGIDCLYPIANLHPERKPRHITDTEFEKLLPYGTPFFKEKSAVIARRVYINEEFNKTIVEKVKAVKWDVDSYEKAMEAIKPEYEKWKRENKIILSKETEADYQVRIKNEIFQSKGFIEKKLDKKVEFLCWPHGDNNEFCHNLALEAGYLMTTTGKAINISPMDYTRIGKRIGINFSDIIRKLKTVAKLKAFAGISPFTQLMLLKNL